MARLELAGVSGELVGSGGGPLLVLLHGYGAPGTDLVGLARELRLPAGTRCFFPAALEPAPIPGGRAWWQLDLPVLLEAFARGDDEAVARGEPEGLVRARDAINALLPALCEQLKVEPAQLVLGGFSQGSMVACDVALHTELPLGGLVLYSSMVLAEPTWRACAAASVARRRVRGLEPLPVVQSHGRYDPLLPFRVGERLRGLLTEAGMAPTWVPFDGMHGIGPAALRATETLLARVAASADNATAP